MKYASQFSFSQLLLMNSLKKGDHIVLGTERQPCKVLHVQRSTPGKHGHAQFNVTGRDLITGNRVNELFKHHSHYTPFELTTETYTGIDIDEDGYVSFMLEDGSIEELAYHSLDGKQKESIDEFSVKVRTMVWEGPRGPERRQDIIELIIG